MSAPATPIPPDILRRLTFARSLAFLSAQLRAGRNDVSNAEAIVLQDASAETVIRVALDVKGGHANPRTPFPELVEELSRVLPAVQPHLRSLEQLHEARNAVQHRLIIPAESQVEQYEREAVSAIRGIIQDGLWIPIEQISLSGLFGDPVARELYQRAEGAYWARDYESTIIGLVACFEYGRLQEQHRNWGSLVTVSQIGAELSAEDDERFGSVLGYLKKVHEEVEVLKLGLDYKEYRRFADVAFGLLNMDYILVPPFGQTADQMLSYWRERLAGQKDLNGVALGIGYGVRADMPGWIGFALRFVASATLRWQQTSRMGFDEILRGAFKRLLEPSQPKPNG